MTVRVPAALKNRLDKLAGATSCSRSWLAAHALEVYVEDQEWQLATIRKGKRDVHAGRIVSHVHPHLGRPGRESETRELLVAGTPYIAPYRVHRDRLAILAVLHAAQDNPPREWKKLDTLRNPSAPPHTATWPRCVHLVFRLNLRGFAWGDARRRRSVASYRVRV